MFSNVYSKGSEKQAHGDLWMTQVYHYWMSTNDHKEFVCISIKYDFYLHQWMVYMLLWYCFNKCVLNLRIIFYLQVSDLMMAGIQHYYYPQMPEITIRTFIVSLIKFVVLSFYWLFFQFKNFGKRGKYQSLKDSSFSIQAWRKNFVLIYTSS